jgi:DNA-binding NtrC family response regulator
MAPNGTLFLDEVGEMSPRMQVVLLRFLETGEIQRVGADRSHTRVNIRLITATNRDLEAQVAAGAFREDLYFRLNVIRLRIPPLRERVEDIPQLVKYFLHSYQNVHRTPVSDVSPEAMETLVTYRWPGNVRELRNVVERVVLKTTEPVVAVSDLPAEVRRAMITAVDGRAAGSPPAVIGKTVADELSERMLDHGESFWAAVYPLFIARDLTRTDLRRIIQTGLERTNGNYRMLVESFNMATDDYKRFLSFLRKHDCHLPFQRFRVVPTRLQPQAAISPSAKARVS